MEHAFDSQYQLLFRSMIDRSCWFAFPCDRQGNVDLDALSDRARCNYLYARALVGLRLLPPAVVSRDLR